MDRPPLDSHPVRLALDHLPLDATLTSPRRGARGLVVLAGGDRDVAGRLHEVGLATLLSDGLAAPQGAGDDLVLQRRLDVALLARRLRGAAEWAHDDPRTRDLELGVLGAGAGAAAALIVAADRRARVRAVVTCGGHLEDAGAALARVRAPTLLIVGAHEAERSRDAARRLAAEPRDLLLVEGAADPLRAPGELDEAATAAVGWFEVHLGRAEAPPAPSPVAEPCRVGELMTRDVVTCAPDDALSVAARLLWDHDLVALPVVDGGGKVVGMLTDRDVGLAAYAHGLPLHELRVAAAMAPGAHACREDDPPRRALATMVEHQVRRLPVLDDQGRVAGIVSIDDLARAALVLDEAEIDVSPAEALEAAVAASRPRRRPAVAVGVAP